ncbi:MULTISPECIES: MHYT domain-containing protein [Streptomyces]|uniref:MHYT domain-containing protein n=1 Tax=Streptomyces TaxID=1883 RepID=UPI00140B29E0|nr:MULTISPECIES: MHYT domain-containing protein [Streptomyces]MDH6227510.1 NO-binding membrane sensor protein with MHYT domain [Streptomyces sp. MJP52]
MQGTVDGFSHGLITPVAAYVMACLGGALGLRCTTRALLVGRRRAAWLALGSAAIGSGIWTMHFIAMTGFSVEGTPVRYDLPTTFASLAVAIVMVGIGTFLVGYWNATGAALFTGGTLTGLGIASMHYLGMAGMRLHGELLYDTPTVALSVLIGVIAATSALWAASQVRGPLWSVGASLVMGLAVTGMHYTGMAAATVHLHDDPAGVPPGDAAGALLGPMLAGPLVFLLLAGVVVMFDPHMVMSRPAPRRAPEDLYGPLPGSAPAARPGQRPALRGGRRSSLAGSRDEDRSAAWYG